MEIMSDDNSVIRIVKTKYKSLEDFKRNFDLLKCLGLDVSAPETLKKDFNENSKQFVQRIEAEYKDGDEIWHCDNTELFVRSGQEFISLRRKNEIIKNYIIKTL